MSELAMPSRPAAPWVPKHGWQTAWQYPPGAFDEMRRRLDRWLKLELLGLLPILGPRQSGSWQIAHNQALSSGTSASFQSCTCRQFIPQAALGVTGGSQVRITFAAGSGQLD